MRVQLIGHFEPCMTEIYLHIVARMADYMATHPIGAVGVRAAGEVVALRCARAKTPPISAGSTALFYSALV